MSIGPRSTKKGSFFRDVRFLWMEKEKEKERISILYTSTCLVFVYDVRCSTCVLIRMVFLFEFNKWIEGISRESIIRISVWTTIVKQIQDNPILMPIIIAAIILLSFRCRRTVRRTANGSITSLWLWHGWIDSRHRAPNTNGASIWGLYSLHTPSSHRWHTENQRA